MTKNGNGMELKPRPPELPERPVGNVDDGPLYSFVDAGPLYSSINETAQSQEMPVYSELNQVCLQSGIIMYQCILMKCCC